MRWPWQRDEVEVDSDVRTAVTLRDERLSAYLDGLLPAADRGALEADSDRDGDLRAALEGLRSVKAAMGELGLASAPRSFAIAPELVLRPRGIPRIELFARVGAVAAALALTVVSVAPSITGGSAQFATRAVSDTAAPSQEAAVETNTQAADAAPQAPPQTSESRAAAPAPAPADPRGGAAGATQAAPAVAPAVPGAPAAPTPSGAPATTSTFGAPAEATAAAGGDSARAPLASPPSPGPLDPAELSQGAEETSRLRYAQLGFAVTASVLTLLALLALLRRTVFR